MADQAVVSGANFTIALLLARNLPPDAFGQFSLALLACLFVANLHRAVFTQPMNVLGVAETPAQSTARMRAVLRAHWLALPVGASVVSLASFLLFPDPVIAASAIVYLSGLLLQETLRRHWYTHRDIRKALNNDLAGYSLQVAALFLINSFMPLQVSTALLAMGAGAFAAFGLGMTSVVKVGPKDVVKVETLVAQHWPLTSWLVVTVLAVWGAGQLYPFLITPLGVAAVAAFMACRNILNVMGLLVQSIGNFLPSHVARLRRRDGEVAVCRHLLLTCLASAVACGFFLLVLLIGGGPLLSLLYGGMYDEASTLLNVLALATVCSVFGALFGAYALGLEDSRSGFFSNLGATAVTFTVGLYLIWRWGIDGAAWGAVASSATASVLQAWFVLARLRVGTVRPE